MEKLVKFCEDNLFEPFPLVRQRLAAEFPGCKTSVVPDGLNVIVSVDDHSVVIGQQHNVPPQPEPHVFIREITNISMAKFNEEDNSVCKTVTFDFYFEPCDNLSPVEPTDEFYAKLGKQFMEAFKRKWETPITK
jgi:hypothetical protein